MKIAINCVFFTPKGGGIKEYIYNLTKNLGEIDRQNDYVVYVLSDMKNYAEENFPKYFRIKTLPFRSGSQIEVVKRSLFEHKFWTKEEKLEKWNLFHSPMFHAPNLKHTPVILTVHDMRFFRFPKTYAFLRYHFLKHKVKNSIKRADHIISISQFTKDEIQNAYGIPPEKISVIHEAINPQHFSRKISVRPSAVPEALETERFLLSVGHLEPRKNYIRLIDAFENLKQRSDYADLKLVIVGRKDHSYGETLRRIEMNPHISYLNFVDNDSLLWLYQNTELFVFPTFYEGFGFPPLEAAVSGTVSAVSNTSSIPEVCGDAALYFDPMDVISIQLAIEKGLDRGKSYSEIKEALPLQLGKFSWENNARETLKLYNNFLKSK